MNDPLVGMHATAGRTGKGRPIMLALYSAHQQRIEIAASIELMRRNGMPLSDQYKVAGLPAESAKAVKEDPKALYNLDPPIGAFRWVSLQHLKGKLGYEAVKKIYQLHKIRVEKMDDLTLYGHSQRLKKRHRKERPRTWVRLINPDGDTGRWVRTSL